MARLSPEQRKAWLERASRVAEPWLVGGLDSRVDSLAERVGGMAGILDWLVHGQVSRLLKREALGAEEFCLVPGPQGRPNVLLYQYGGSPDAKLLSSKMKGLGVQNICLAETTFPKDFLAKLKQNLGREGISCTKLEPEPQP